MGLNVVTLVGRAGRDPEIRYFESGSVLCTVTIAVKRPTSKSDEPDWFRLEFWGKTAEIASNYVKKGGLIGVKGSLKIDTWSDRSTGTPRSQPVIRVDQLDLLGSKRDIDTSMVNNYDLSEF